MLQYCTLTGVDANTSTDGIIDLAAEFPWAEFGILFSRTRPGTENRYPTVAEITRILDALDQAAHPVNLALHVCGRAVNELVSGNVELRELAKRFGRVQLNFVASRIPFSAADLERYIASVDHPVITQHNVHNAPLNLSLSAPNHQILFDASGGRGVRAEHWPAAVDGKLCGYAGGIGPETVAQDLADIMDASGGQAAWIDMEGRLRADDLFDLSICHQVLDRGAYRDIEPAVTVVP